LAAKFRLQLHDELQALTDELQASQSTAHNDLTVALATITRVGDIRALQEIRDELWQLAGTMET
jgi:hypothetical protein